MLIHRSAQFSHKCRRIQQAGFIPNRSTTEQVSNLRQVIGKAREFLHIGDFTFVNFKAAFVLVDRESQ